MKTKLLIFLLFFSTNKLLAQNQFKFSDCFNHWCDFQEAGNGIKVRASYWKNSAGNQWWCQFMNTTNNPISFTYTVYGGGNQLTRSLKLNAHAVSGELDANEGLGSLYGEDIFISCAFAEKDNKSTSKPNEKDSVK